MRSFDTFSHIIRLYCVHHMVTRHHQCHALQYDDFHFEVVSIYKYVLEQAINNAYNVSSLQELRKCHFVNEFDESAALHSFFEYLQI